MQEVGLFLKACKRAWRGLAKHKTNFSYHLPPTSHIPAKPTNRAHAASMSHDYVAADEV